MTKRLFVLAAVTTGALALPFIAKANDCSHNLGAMVISDARSALTRADARSTTPSAESAYRGERGARGEAVRADEGTADRSTRRRSGPAGDALAGSVGEQPFLPKGQVPNDPWHGP